MHIPLFAKNYFFTFPVILLKLFCGLMFQRRSSAKKPFKEEKKDWSDIIYILQLLTMLLMNLSIQFLATRHKFLSIDL